MTHHFDLSKLLKPMRISRVSAVLTIALLVFSKRSRSIDGFHCFMQSWTASPLGQATPILPPPRSWLRADGGGYWGPSLSWNTHVGAFMLLLNKVSGAKAFDADGNYLAFLPHIETPSVAPATPIRLDALPNGPTPAWYVQALGDPAMHGTSAWTGQDARLFLGEHSHLALHFSAPTRSPDAR